MARSVPYDASFDPTITSARKPVPQQAPASAAPRRGLLRRIVDALIESQQRRAEREVANYLRRGGLKFTDQVEREVERRFLHVSSERL